MKFGLVGLLACGVLTLAGCQARPTLAEAQAFCAKQGGLLTVIYTQKVTASGIGAPIKQPGECIDASKFEKTAPAPDKTPAPAK